jgi:hypothetical protein
MALEPYAQGNYKLPVDWCPLLHSLGKSCLYVLPTIHVSFGADISIYVQVLISKSLDFRVPSLYKILSRRRVRIGHWINLPPIILDYNSSL